MSKDSSSKEEEDDFETPTMSFESFLTYDAPTSVKKKKKLSSSLSSSSTSHSRPSHSTTTHHKSTPPPVPSSTSSSSKVNKANGNKRPRSDSVAATSQKRKRVRNPVHAGQSLYLSGLASHAQSVTLDF